MDEYFTVLANGQSSGEVFDEREDATAWLEKHSVGDVEDPEGDGRRWEDEKGTIFEVVECDSEGEVVVWGDDSCATESWRDD
jgi:hypothetical protein